MPDREQSDSLRMDEKPQRNITGEGVQTSGSKGQERDHGVKDQGSVGRDVPDQSKERNTEIAVEAGHKAGEQPSNKR